MSSNKTTNYQLHSWEPGDDFLRSEFNENFQRLDQATRVMTGCYTGTYISSNGYTHQTIDLGFQPKAVLVMPRDGNLNNYNGGVATPELPAMRTPSNMILFEVVVNGFKVYGPPFHRRQ